MKQISVPTADILLRASDSMLDGEPEASMSAQSRRNAFCFHVGCVFEAYAWTVVRPGAQERARAELETLGFTW